MFQQYHPQNLILTNSRLKPLCSFLISFFLVSLCIWGVFYENDLDAVLLIAGAVIMTITLLKSLTFLIYPPVLTIGLTGFTVEKLGTQKNFNWNDVSEFGLIDTAYGVYFLSLYRVEFDSSSGRHILDNTFGISPRKLHKLMNDYRDNYLRQLGIRVI